MFQADPKGFFSTSSFRTAQLIVEWDLINAGTNSCVLTTFWQFCHLQNTSLNTRNDGIHFKNPFGFQDNFWFQDEAFGFQYKGNWLVKDDTLAILATLILIKKLLRFLRYWHLNICSRNQIKFEKFI